MRNHERSFCGSTTIIMTILSIIIKYKNILIILFLLDTGYKIFIFIGELFQYSNTTNITWSLELLLSKSLEKYSL